MPRPPILFVVAHPDDETIFFGATIAAASTRQRVDVVCATSRFDDDPVTATRRNEFRRACWMMGARGEMLPFDDTAEPLPIDRLTAALTRLVATRHYAAVHTHGVWGEYGHRHHRDVCLATHRAWRGHVLSLAGPLACAAQALDDRWRRATSEPVTPAVGSHPVATLDCATLAAKRRVARTYHSQPFASQWCSPVEAFVRLRPACVEALHAVGNGHHSPDLTFEDDDVRRSACVSLAALEGAGLPWPEAANIPADVWLPARRVFTQRLRSELVRTT